MVTSPRVYGDIEDRWATGTPKFYEVLEPLQALQGSMGSSDDCAALRTVIEEIISVMQGVPRLADANKYKFIMKQVQALRAARKQWFGTPCMSAEPMLARFNQATAVMEQFAKRYWAPGSYS